MRSLIVWPVVLAVAIAGMLAGLAGQSQAPRQVDLIVTGGTVVTVDATHRVLTDGAVAISGADIVAVDTAEAIRRQFRGADTIDATGAVVMPGLVNTHTHAPMSLFRGLADDLALMDWLNNYIFPAVAKLVSPEFVRAGTRLAVLEMIQSGTTTYADMYYFEEEVARATRGCGASSARRSSSFRYPTRRPRLRDWRERKPFSRSSPPTS